jgi:hypothetical protein
MLSGLSRYISGVSHLKLLCAALCSISCSNPGFECSQFG